MPVNPDDMAVVTEWCNARNIDCLYWLCPAHEYRAIRQAEANQFCLVDIRLTMQCGHESLRHKNTRNTMASIRLAIEPDKQTLMEIAKESHRNTRFFNDGHFPVRLCEELYGTWIGRDLLQRDGRVVLVAESNSETVGYVACRTGQDETGQIDLLAVKESTSGNGIGRQLLFAAYEWLINNGAKQATVVTQGANPVAQRLYQQCGFRTKSVEFWYHKWFTREKGLE
jgi:ribosomal protein S18 acetylase RimI-like enzyme